MLERNIVDMENLIDEKILDTYYKNMEQIKVLKEKEGTIIKEIEIKNYKKRKGINELEKENKIIELIIQNILLAEDKSKVTVNDTDIILDKQYKVSAKLNKKEKLIEYIRDNNLPVYT